MATATSRWRALAALLRPDSRRWVGLGLSVALASGLSLAGPLVVRRIIDMAADGAAAEQLTSLALLYLALAIATQLITVVVSWFATVTAWHTTNQIRLQLAGHVLGLDHEFHRRHTPGELIQRVDGDVTSVSDFLGRVVPRVVGAAAMVVGMVAVLAVVDWRLAIGALAYVVLSAGLIVRGRHRAVGEASDEMGAYAQLYGGIEERLTAAEDLRANGAGSHAMWRFIEESAGAMHSSVRRESAFLRLWWAVQGSVAVGSSVSLVAGALLVSNGSISLGTAFLMFQYVLLLERPLEDVVQQLETVQKANGAMVRVIDLLAERPTIIDAGTTCPAAGPLAIDFDAVSFGYASIGHSSLHHSPADTGTSDGDRVLHQISLSIGAGRSVGIVGRTGSGKTTLSRLVVRLVEATHGQVRLGGVAIADIPMVELRRRVALIPQEVELFSGTVRDNVTLFDPDPTDQQVAGALHRVGLSALVTGGIHRELGAGGAGLSAGEAQLLALARVWLREPDLVVLDEATARIDPATEVQLETAIAELMRGRTTIVIAHRLSTLRHVDEIVVLDHGIVVEHGTREALAADTSGRFHQLLALALEDTA
ncbi:MAG: ABC transporter ATP-binding protein [Actinobacteria bacterium]|nr:ABC transporter ATP-binding protein [Acidimicrobiaceae bacterium]MBP6487182.1 ABC transporter ATP-binding protein [Ilumatobacteraceae bacterium]NMD23848.1 ABC transporter ATP-binding protein [Actinomycetota bacterium]MBP8208652.1 ABC transporter ATP-binding protein [Ilumatobacteraceae bacterium]HQY14066.1 ABC transporter ATP-binding protein [Ilumatobacteraceae bacterium]